MWVAVHIILAQTTEDNGERRTMDEDLLLKLMPEHVDIKVISSAKCDLLSYMDMRLSENFDPFCTILSELTSIANDY
jgi:hypothetical protein